jgi:dTDP-4-amino-4,6-dideoxygalactose transaminase
MNNLSAAYACASLEELEYNLKQKKQIAAWYREELADISDIRLPPKLPGRESSYWMFGILLASSADRDSVSKRMREQFHVDSRPFFHPLHVQVPLRKYHRGKADLPIAMSMGRSGLYLPSGTTLRREEITSVACALRCSLGKT